MGGSPYCHPFLVLNLRWQYLRFPVDITTISLPHHARVRVWATIELTYERLYPCRQCYDECRNCYA